MLGSALATIGLTTIGLTIPAVLTIGLLSEKVVVLGLEPVEMILLLTLAVSSLTFTGNRTTILQGAIHLPLFFVYVSLLFEK